MQAAVQWNGRVLLPGDEPGVAVELARFFGEANTSSPMYWQEASMKVESKWERVSNNERSA